MGDFKFIRDKASGKGVIIAPKREQRPSDEEKKIDFCPFCPGFEFSTKEISRVGDRNNWKVRVVENKYPFSQVHEVIIHSPDHNKNFDELPLAQTELIFEVFKKRFEIHESLGDVFIFHNHGEGAGESLTHPHTQLAVVSKNTSEPMPLTDISEREMVKETAFFDIFVPLSSGWPDEVWLNPKRAGKSYSEVSKEEIHDLAKIVTKLIQLLNIRHKDLAYNFYIYPQKDWYLRFIPRTKVLGGFELGSGVMVNTTNPLETKEFLKENWS